MALRPGRHPGNYICTICNNVVNEGHHCSSGKSNKGFRKSSHGDFKYCRSCGKSCGIEAEKCSCGNKGSTYRSN